MFKKSRVYIVLLTVLLVATGFMQIHLQQRLDRGQEELAVLRDRGEELGGHQAELLAEVAELREELNRLSSVLDTSIEARSRQLQSGAGGEAEGGDAMADGTPADSPEAARELSFNEVMRERLRSPEVLDHMARENVQSQFGAFIKSLELSQEDEEELTRLMEEVIKQQRYAQGRLASGEISRAEYARLSDPNLMTRTLRDFLTEDEMKAFERYQADAPVRVRASIEANQYVSLGNSAPGLTDENRAYVASVFADVMTSQEARFLMLGNPDALPEVFEIVERRLEGNLNPEQMKIVSDYLERQNRMRELMGP